MKKIIFTLTIISLTLISCKKCVYKACYTVDKSTANIGDTITFRNCSDYGGGYTNATWVFGDTPQIVAYSAYTKGQESVKHSYTSSGQYETILRIGEKENGSEQKIIIIIK